MLKVAVSLLFLISSLRLAANTSNTKQEAANGILAVAGALKQAVVEEEEEEKACYGNS